MTPTRCEHCGCVENVPSLRGHRPGCEKYQPPASCRLCPSCGHPAGVLRVEHDPIEVTFACSSCDVTWTETTENDPIEKEPDDMTETPMNRRELETSAERQARALLTGFTSNPPVDPMGMLGAELPQIPTGQQGEWLALVAAAATAMHAGSMTALQVLGADTAQALVNIALAREATLAEQDDDGGQG